MKLMLSTSVIVGSLLIPTVEVAASPVGHVVTKETIVLGLTTQWITNDTDPTAYQPDGGPMFKLPVWAQVKFACIRYVESRNHPTSLNHKSGAGGLYGFLPYIWSSYGGTKYAPYAQDANPVEQDQIAVNVYTANLYHGFTTEWSGDCPQLPNT